MTTQYADTAAGWRIWHVNTSDDPAVLHPPCGGAPGCVPAPGETMWGGYVGRWHSR